jgi:hypothetical protein
MHLGEAIVGAPVQVGIDRARSTEHAAPPVGHLGACREPERLKLASELRHLHDALREQA